MANTRSARQDKQLWLNTTTQNSTLWAHFLTYIITTTTNLIDSTVESDTPALSPSFSIICETQLLTRTFIDGFLDRLDLHPLHETQATTHGSPLNGLPLSLDCTGGSCSGSQAVVEEQSQETVIFASQSVLIQLHFYNYTYPIALHISFYASLGLYEHCGCFEYVAFKLCGFYVVVTTSLDDTTLVPILFVRNGMQGQPQVT
jgi:hypothetical protein